MRLDHGVLLVNVDECLVGHPKLVTVRLNTHLKREILLRNIAADCPSRRIKWYHLFIGMHKNSPVLSPIHGVLRNASVPNDDANVR
jgi:hypothetical protein